MLPTGTSNQQEFVSSDANRHFRTDHLKDDLAGRFARGGAVTIAAQALRFVIRTASTIALARLLTPQDYGLIAMVVILVDFVSMFQHLGLSTATIKWSEIDHRQVSTLFWINVVMSAAIMLVTAGCAPLLAWFYKEPRLIPITACYAVSIFLTGVNIQHEAILSRQMRFGAIALIELSAIVIGLAAAILAAVYGAGYWALVVNQLVMTTCTVIGVWTACRWRPGLPARGAGVRSMLSYGGHLTGFNLMNYFARNTDNALIGKFWGAYQLGVYSRAYQLLLMPMSQINNPLVAVAVPALSRLTDSPERYRAAYLKIVEKIAMITMPGIVFMIAMSDSLVLFLLGPQWREAGRIFMLLGVAAIIQPVTRTVPWLFTTQGRAREMFKWGIAGSVIAVASILGGLRWGAAGVAASYAATDLCIATPLLFWYAGRRGPVRTKDFYRVIAPSVCASLCALAALLLCRAWLAALPNLLARLSLAFAITAVVSIVVLAALPAGRLAMRNLKDILLLLLRPKRESVA
ncbi:MAG: lipopolysaccharide biosynthesis protein [Acidobacteria bacterium]|nr:MAG: lipopolysaccharide biosynthesis protein [Acidobacteriota bacterium]